MKKILLLLLFFQNLIVYSQVTEKVYLHTDKSAYHTGEIIWFKADIVDGRTYRPVDLSKVVYAEIIDTSGKPLFRFKIGLKGGSGSASFKIPATVRSGGYILSAYTNWMKNFSPENYFHKEILLLNVNDSAKFFPCAKIPELHTGGPKPSSLNIEVNADKKQYKIREKIVVSVSSPEFANLSMSVYKIDSLQHPAESDVAKILSGVSTNMHEEKSAFKFPPEYNGHIITGKVVNTKTGQLVPGVTGYLSVRGKNQFSQVSTSDSSGKIIFQEKGFYGVNEVVVQTNLLTDSSYHIELDDPFSSKHIIPLKDSIKASGINQADRQSLELSAIVQDVYSTDIKNSFEKPVRDTFTFYDYPVANYKIDDYVKFSTLEEVLREYVTQVGVQKRNGKLFPFVFDKLSRKPFTNSPLYLVDGIPVFDVGRITSMRALSIKNIEVVDNRFFRGSKSFEGIIAISTKRSDFELEKNARLVNYEGLLPDRKFISPVYESEEQRADRLPDFRNVLYWSPEINGKQKVEFYSSDIKGDYAIVVQGIAANGEVGSKSFIFKVE